MGYVVHEGVLFYVIREGHRIVSELTSAIEKATVFKTKDAARKAIEDNGGEPRGAKVVQSVGNFKVKPRRATDQSRLEKDAQRFAFERALREEFADDDHGVLEVRVKGAELAIELTNGTVVHARATAAVFGKLSKHRTQAKKKKAT